MPMTFKEFVELNTPDDPPIDTLFAVLVVLRSGIQGDFATTEGIAASTNKWIEQHGEITREKVDKWVAEIWQKAPKLADIVLPDKWLLELLKLDPEEDDTK